MHTEINYDALFGSDEIGKELKALQDVKNWLGLEKYEAIVEDLKKLEDTEANRAQLRFAFMFGGIQGYPVDVMLNTFLGTRFGK